MGCALVATALDALAGELAPPNANENELIAGAADAAGLLNETETGLLFGAESAPNKLVFGASTFGGVCVCVTNGDTFGSLVFSATFCVAIGVVG